MTAKKIEEARAFILAGQLRQSESTVAIRSPYDQSVVAEVCQAGPEDATLAVDASSEAFARTRRLPSYERARILSQVSDEIAGQKEEFARVIALEAGKPIRDARTEVGRAINTFAVAAEEAKRIGGEVIPLDWTPGSENFSAIVRRFPIGPVLGITPFNFPLNLVAHKLAPAVASGNPIIIKPAPQSPLSALHLGEVVLRAGWPAEALSVIPCPNEVAGRMVHDPRIKKLTFTGSAEVGWRLKGEVPHKKVTLELGGNAAVIVHNDADTETAVRRCLLGGFTYAGQSCISVQRLYLHEEIAEAFIENFIEGVRGLKVGDPLNEAMDLGPMINPEAAERAESWVKEAVNAGARLLAGGKREGSLLGPTVLTDVRQNQKVFCEEVFAPVVVIERYDDFDGVLDRVNDSRYGLQ
ncbi:MAG TPA: aldehyde dehydrogenase family protein, partial [Blastocatellia bacterium]|nr:aldehyde dehydrogenase family protein [Blastocatellia bacterium]